ncbi:MAG: hypothetical protein J1E81_05135 [Eubacterium sp.]|nr:hypothetical protein [Eubacterium sp.]
MKLLKKIIPFVLSFLIVFCSLPFTASAASVNANYFDYWEAYYSGGNDYFNDVVDSSSYPGYKSCYKSNVSGTLRRFYIEHFDYNKDGTDFKLNKGDSFNAELYTTPNTRFASFSPEILFYCVDSSGVRLVSFDGSFDRSTGKISFSGTMPFQYDKTILARIAFNNVTDTSTSSVFQFVFKNFSIDVESEQSGFFDSVKQAFSNLWQWLQNILNSIKEIPSKIGEALSNLSNNIKGFFTDLGNNLNSWFADIGNWFSTLGDNIKGFFANLADNISGFFEKLWNRIWWGNENGESDYEKPVINNKLNDILATLNDYQNNLKGTIDSISKSANEVSTYISTGTELVNGIINVAGAGITALLVFGIVFILARKVVGR